MTQTIDLILILSIYIHIYYFRISYLDIFKVVELTCDKHRSDLVETPSLEEIIHYDLWAREYASAVPIHVLA